MCLNCACQNLALIRAHLLKNNFIYERINKIYNGVAK
nr:MAG TPA: hypothetical protein [Caudoviricetes sp.]